MEKEVGELEEVTEELQIRDAIPEGQIVVQSLYLFE